jgi:DNA-binding transcriptional MocR family regulator
MPSISTRSLPAALGQWRTRSGSLSVALADAVREGVLDGRIPVGGELPSQREMAGTFGVSRGTVVAALRNLRSEGWIVTRHGSGSTLQLPPRLTERTAPLSADHGIVDLRAAVTSAPYHACLAAADRAVGWFPATLLDDGAVLGGLACLRAAVADRYTAAGLATRPEQILITSGARAAISLLIDRFHDRRRPVLVENPSYPSALALLRQQHARLVTVPVTASGWDTDRLLAQRPGLAYLMPDFHNPSGALMSDRLRASVSDLASRADFMVISDETMRDLDLRDPAAPFPHLAGRNVVSVGSASKLFWGGIRIGWIRATAAVIGELLLNPLAAMISPPPLEQLIATELFTDEASILPARRTQLRRQRDHLVSLLRQEPGWSFEVPPGGLCLWMRLGNLPGQQLADRARTAGLLIAPGHWFSPDGTLAHHVRLPYTATAQTLTKAVAMLRTAAAECGSPVRA